MCRHSAILRRTRDSFRRLQTSCRNHLDSDEGATYKAAIPRCWAAFSPARRARVAQLVEHATENRSVASSILAPGTINLEHFHRLEWAIRSCAASASSRNTQSAKSCRVHRSYSHISLANTVGNWGAYADDSKASSWISVDVCCRHSREQVCTRTPRSRGQNLSHERPR
jgi:hypothetical protein